MITNTIYLYPNIIAKMAVSGDTIATLAKELGMGYQALSARLRGKKSFELPEIYAIMRKYNESFEYLFTARDDRRSA